jgi:Na+-transporting NADH:ubiquinone oxidoreductase subunit NqrE
MHHFTSRTTITFRTIQGLTTLLDQWQAALLGLVASLMEDVGVTGPLTTEAIANFDTSSHVIGGRYAIPLSSVHEFVSGLASWVDSIVDEADEG